MWIPHDQVVWIGGELTKDLKEDGVLEIELEDGNVSCCFMLIDVVSENSWFESRVSLTFLFLFEVLM